MYAIVKSARRGDIECSLRSFRCDACDDKEGDGDGDGDGGCRVAVHSSGSGSGSGSGPPCAPVSSMSTGDHVHIELLDTLPLQLPPTMRFHRHTQRHTLVDLIRLTRRS